METTCKKNIPIISMEAELAINNWKNNELYI